MDTTPTAERTCPVCRTTLTDLHTKGRMGCAACYRTFAPEVEQAAQYLHGITPPEENPWPTRRATALPADSTPPIPPLCDPLSFDGAKRRVWRDIATQQADKLRETK